MWRLHSLQKMVLSPELSPSSRILSCCASCQSMEEVAKVVSTICEKLEGRADSGASAIAAQFLDEAFFATAAVSPLARSNFVKGWTDSLRLRTERSRLGGRANGMEREAIRSFIDG
ncbi:unnamed protein product [Symbiodinium sp. CCMP2592]|nr:unnamed protein product [Symbiodinium sp. CCMP2592]